jgi:hypothetical protein
MSSSEGFGVRGSEDFGRWVPFPFRRCSWARPSWAAYGTTERSG